MLDPWIIEEIRRREERRSRLGERPVVEIPAAPPDEEECEETVKEKGGERGVTVVDFTV